MSHYHHFSTQERESILKFIGSGMSEREIAQTLGRNRSSIRREIARNRGTERYSPGDAEKRYRKKRKQCHQPRILDDPDAKALVAYLIKEQQWSPEEISNWLRYTGDALHLSYPTIYRAIKRHMFEPRRLAGHEVGFAKHLRRKGKPIKRADHVENRGRLAAPHGIEERPAAAGDRSEVGHLELDTILGKRNTGCGVTIVDRMTRMLYFGKADKHDAASVAKVIIELLEDLPPQFVRSLTPDRGKEFHFFKMVSEALHNVPFYFPPPASPWMRPTNENTNGLLREYIPKHADLSKSSDADFRAIAVKLNNRPRKCLLWLSPFEAAAQQLLHLG